jgi:hypothetical protein
MKPKNGGAKFNNHGEEKRGTESSAVNNNYYESKKNKWRTGSSGT